MGETLDRSLTFGGARLDRRRRIVTDVAGRETVLRAKSYDVLAVLLERADEAVTKDELFSKVWNGVAVTEDVLVQCVTDIRKAIGEKGHEAIKTVTKVGYRLVPDAATAVNVLKLTVPTRSVHPRGIAVLPFANHSTDPDQDFLADGLAEDVITDLSRSADLFVIAHNSSFSFKSKEQDHSYIASELGVRYLVEGSLRKSGERLRITARLIDAQSNGAQVWAERYESAYKDVFDIQDEISQQVTKAIVGRLTDSSVPRQRPASMEVFELSMRGRDNWIKSRSKTEEEIHSLTRAVELDLGYAPTQSQLARTYLFRWGIWMHPGNSSLDLALKFASRGVALDHNDHRVRLVHAMVLLHHKEWRRAEAEFTAALAINPNGADIFATKAFMLAFAGQGLLGLECMKQAMKLNPRAPTWYYWYTAICHNSIGDFDAAIATLRQHGLTAGAFRRTLIYALSQAGQVDEARREAAIHTAENPGFRAAAWIERLTYQDLALKDRHVRSLVDAGMPA
jgi:TolB-like protein